MNLLEKIKSYFSSDNNNTDNENENAIDTTSVKVVEDATDKLKKINTSLKAENRALKDENKQLRDTILTLQKKIDALEKTGYTYSSSSTYTLPKQEPIRAYKPKRNRNYHRKYYKKEDKYSNDETPTFEKIAKPRRKRRDTDFVRSEDIPKPGSHDRIVLHG